MNAATDRRTLRRATSDVDVSAMLERAERQMDRRRTDAGIRFRDVGGALRWYFERRETLTSPKGMHPRSERAADGSQVCVIVDGGGGGDFDDVLATLCTLAQCLKRLHEDLPTAWFIVVNKHRDGMTLREAATQLKCSVSSASAHVGRGESYLAGMLRGAGVLA